MLLPQLGQTALTAAELGQALGQGVSFDAEEVKKLVSTLRKQALEVQDAVLQKPTDAFGARGDYVRYHSAKADEHVRESMKSLVKALDYYAQALDTYMSAQLENDENARRDLERQTERLLARGEGSTSESNGDS